MIRKVIITRDNFSAMIVFIFDLFYCGFSGWGLMPRFIRLSHSPQPPARAGGAEFYGRNRYDTRRRYNTARFLHRRHADRHVAGRNRPRRRQGRRTAEG